MCFQAKIFDYQSAPGLLSVSACSQAKKYKPNCRFQLFTRNSFHKLLNLFGAWPCYIALINSRPISAVYGMSAVCARRPREKLEIPLIGSTRFRIASSAPRCDQCVCWNLNCGNKKMILIYKPNAKLQINVWIPEEAFRALRIQRTVFAQLLTVILIWLIAITLLASQRPAQQAESFCQKLVHCSLPKRVLWWKCAVWAPMQRRNHRWSSYIKRETCVKVITLKL